ERGHSRPGLLAHRGLLDVLRRLPDRAGLVPSAQRERGRRLPRASRPGGGGERRRALLNERRTMPGALHPCPGRRPPDRTRMAAPARPVSWRPKARDGRDLLAPVSRAPPRVPLCDSVESYLGAELGSAAFWIRG